MRCPWPILGPVLGPILGPILGPVLGLLPGLLLALAAVPVAAKTDPDRMDRHCRDGWARVMARPDGWRQFSDISIIANGLPPDLRVDAQRLQVGGLRRVPHSGLPQTDWPYAAQSRACGIGALSVAAFPATGKGALARLVAGAAGPLQGLAPDATWTHVGPAE